MPAYALMDEEYAWKAILDPVLSTVSRQHDLQPDSAGNNLHKLAED